MKRKGRKRLSVDVPTELHKNAQYCAKESNITLTKLVARALFEYIRMYYR